MRPTEVCPRYQHAGYLHTPCLDCHWWHRPCTGFLTSRLEDITLDKPVAAVTAASQHHVVPLIEDLVNFTLEHGASLADTPLTVSALILGAALLGVWLFSWLMPRIMVRIFGLAQQQTLRSVGQRGALLWFISASYLAWGVLCVGNRRDLLALEGWYVVAAIALSLLLSVALFDLFLGCLWRGDDAAQARTVASRCFTLVALGAASLLLLRYYGRDVWSVITALGIGSLAIGLAAKETLSNTLSGLVLLMDRPFQVGDRIKLGANRENQLQGDVLEIGLRSTRIKLLDRTVLVLPNSELCNGQLINSSVFELVSGRLEVKLEADFSPQVIAALGNECARLLALDPDAVTVLVSGIGEGWVTLGISYPAPATDLASCNHRIAQHLCGWLPAAGARLYDPRRRMHL